LWYYAREKISLQSCQVFNTEPKREMATTGRKASPKITKRVNVSLGGSHLPSEDLDPRDSSPILPHDRYCLCRRCFCCLHGLQWLQPQDILDRISLALSS